MHRRWRGARSALPGRRWSPPWPFVEPPPPPETPAQFQSRRFRRPQLAIRGTHWTVAPETPPAEPTPWIPTSVGSRCPWAAPSLRGSRWDPPVLAAAEPPPPEIPATWRGNRATWRPRPRPGVIAEPPAAVSIPPKFQTARRPRSWPLLHRGHTWSPPWLVEVPGDPGVWTPRFLRHASLDRRIYPRPGMRFDPPWPFVEPPVLDYVPIFISLDSSTTAGTLDGGLVTVGQQDHHTTAGSVE